MENKHKKTKIMRLSNGKETKVNISIDGKELEQARKVCYLGTRTYCNKLCKES